MEITITQAEEEEEFDDYEDMNRFLRRIQKSPVRKARKNTKAAVKQYNIVRDRLRHEKKKCIKKAMIELRENFRREYREAQTALRSTIKKEWEEEKKVCIDLLGESVYLSKPWFELHKLLGTGIQFKDEMSGRKNDPWNASFWYA
jgi:hypothetical protein